MHIAIQKIVQFKSNIKLEYVYNVLIVSIVAIILMLALIAHKEPVAAASVTRPFVECLGNWLDMKV